MVTMPWTFIPFLIHIPPPPCLSYDKNFRVSAICWIASIISVRWRKRLFTPDAIRDVSTDPRVAYDNIHPY